MALVIIGAIAFLWRGSKILTSGKQPQQVLPAAPVRKETYVYDASMHSDAGRPTAGAGHAWPGLRIAKTVTEDGTVASKEVTEYEYDFIPQGSNSFFTTGEVVYREKMRTAGGVGVEPSPASDTVAAYFPITEEGFKAAKAWADSTVTRDGGHARTPPGRPPNYKVLTYNCVNYTLELCRHAGVETTDYKQSGPSTPSNLVSMISQKNCKHEWELHAVNHPGIPVPTEGIITPESTNIWVCKLCGQTKPFQELAGPPPGPPPR